MLRDHEKFWAFISLGLGVLLLCGAVTFHTPDKPEAIRIIDAAVGGFLLALGAAANALFRSRSDAVHDELTQSVVDKLPPPTGDAKIQKANIGSLEVTDSKISSEPKPKTQAELIGKELPPMMRD